MDDRSSQHEHAARAVGPYQRRRPAEAVLCQLVQEHLETFLALSDDGTGGGLPGCLERDFRKCLDRVLKAFVRWGLLEADARDDMLGWQHGGGFSLDASVRIAADDRDGPERLLRYCARPPLAAGHLRWVEARHEQLRYHPPKPMADGYTELVLSALELLERLSAVITEAPTVRAILTYIGEPGDEAPPISPCRGPPAWEMLDQTVEFDPIHPEPEYEFDQSLSW